MMPFDLTGTAILVGLVGTGIFTLLEVIRHKEIDVLNSALIFLALYAIVVGCDLILAALDGDPKRLPISWREYLCVAGVVCIGVSVQHVLKSMKKLFVNSGRAEVIDDD